MLQPSDLYERTARAARVLEGLDLIVALRGAADAGRSIGQFHEYVRSRVVSHVVAHFNVDELLDYRARRPVMQYRDDRITEVRVPRLELILAEDAAGSPFLLLIGFEPDVRWQLFVAAVEELVRDLRVGTVTVLTTIPLAVPHTRPIGYTVHGTRTDLVERHTAWHPSAEMLASAADLIEVAASELDVPTLGITLNMPHYLAEHEHPGGLVAMLEAIEIGTSLTFEIDDQREERGRFLEIVSTQVDENEELGELIGQLERAYDAGFRAMKDSPLTDQEGRLPSAEAIAEEVERFLRARGGEA